MRVRSRLALLVTSVSLSAGALGAQPAAPMWEVRTSTALDLWFYGLASLGLKGPGSLPYYDENFLRKLNAARETVIDHPLFSRSDQYRLARSFRSDTVFEALHFLPLYYSNDDGLHLIHVLRSLDASGNPLSNVFFRADQRSALRRFADALDGERAFFRSAGARVGGITDQSIRELETLWSEEFVPALQPFIRTTGITRGVILVSPLLGREGRIVQNGSDAVIAVGVAEGAHAPLYHAVRELCFPFKSKLKNQSAALPRADAIESANRAATRCGAMMLDYSMPERAAEYRRVFIASDVKQSGISAAFNAAFPISQSEESLLRSAMEQAVALAHFTSRVQPKYR